MMQLSPQQEEVLRKYFEELRDKRKLTLINQPLDGIGPDAPIETNATGGKQSKPIARLDLIPARALLQVGKVFEYGATRYEKDNWRKISSEEHINKMLIHAYAWLAGDTSDDHAGHAATRALMLLEMTLAGGPHAQTGG